MIRGDFHKLRQHLNELPENARAQIVDLARGGRVRFGKPTKRKAQVLERLTHI